MADVTEAANATASNPSFFEGLEQSMFQWILELFRPMNVWLDSLPPLYWHLTALGLFAVSGIVTLFVPKKYIYAGAPDEEWWRDLRLWTVVTLLPYMAIYYFL